MKNKLQNFWYYYKVPTIIILLIAAAVIYLLSNRETVHYDYDVAVISPRGIPGGQLSQIQSVLERAGRDQNGDGSVAVTVHVYQFAVGMDGQDPNQIAGLDADLVGKQSGIFFTEDPVQFEASTNGSGKASDAVPVSDIQQLSGLGIDDLYLLVRSGADQRYIDLRSALTK